MVAQVEDGDDVRVRAEATHRLGLSGDSGAGGVVQALGLDEGEGYVSVQQGILGEIDHLLPTLAKEPLHLVPAIGEGGGLGLGGIG